MFGLVSRKKYDLLREDYIKLVDQLEKVLKEMSNISKIFDEFVSLSEKCNKMKADTLREEIKKLSEKIKKE